MRFRIGEEDDGARLCEKRKKRRTSKNQNDTRHGCEALRERESGRGGGGQSASEKGENGDRKSRSGKRGMS